MSFIMGDGDGAIRFGGGSGCGLMLEYPMKIH